MEKKQIYKAPAAFSRSPYAMNLNQNKECSGETSNVRTGTSPLTVQTNAIPDDTENVQALSTSPITVQPRYRLQSPRNSYSSPGLQCSSPSVDNMLRSPTHPRNSSGSFPGENFPYPNRSACIQVQPREAAGSMGAVPYPIGTGGCGYGPMGFSVPVAMGGSMNSSRTASLARSPLPDTASHGGSPPGMLMRGPEFISPTMGQVGTPPYHAMEGLSIGSTSNKLTSPAGNNKNSRNHVVPRGIGANNDNNMHQRRNRQSQSRSGTTADDSLNMSVSSASSIEEELDQCPNDVLCALINDRKHQRKYAHTCRLFPCYHGHIIRHAKLFRHSPGQIAESEGLQTSKGGRAKLSAHALGSVNYTSISRDAPNAYKIIVSHRKQSYEIFGDWENVRVHTLKRYLHQVYNIPPTSQVLMLSTGGVLMDDDIESVGNYGVKPENVIVLKRKEDDEPPLVPLE